MTVLFRVDSSPVIGLGHIVRCSTLADELFSRGFRTGFVSRELQSEIKSGLRIRGHQVHLLAPESELAEEEIILGRYTGESTLLVADSYQLTSDWYEMVAKMRLPLLVLDDTADRQLNGTMVLNQNVGFSAKDYEGLVKEDCRVLVGPRYAIVRPEFRDVRNSRRQAATVERILVFISGADLDNLTLLASQAVEGCGFDVDVVTASGHRNLEDIAEWSYSHPRVTHHHQSPRMADLMRRADLAIGAVGSSSWERCCVGLPTIAWTLAENQERSARALESHGAICLLGRWPTAKILDLKRTLKTLDSSDLVAMNSAGRTLIDGRGVFRICDEIEILFNNKLK